MINDLDFTNPYLDKFRQLVRNETNEVVTESGHRLTYVVNKLIIEGSINAYSAKLLDDFNVIDSCGRALVDQLNQDDNPYVYDDEIVELIRLTLFNSVSYIRLLKIKDEIESNTQGVIEVYVTLDKLYVVFKIMETCNIYLITPNVKFH